MDECGSPGCIRKMHLRRVSASILTEMEELAERYRRPENWNHPQIKSDHMAIRRLAGKRGYEPHVMFRALGIDEDKMADAVAALARSASSTQPEPSTVASESLEPNASQAPSEPTTSPSSSPPPFPPLPPAPSGPLGNPTGLVASPGEEGGEIALTWTPAANATAHSIYLREDGSDTIHKLEAEIAGTTGAVTITGVPASKREWYIVIAAQQRSAGEAVIWSEWSNWAAVWRKTSASRAPAPLAGIPGLRVALINNIIGHHPSSG